MGWGAGNADKIYSPIPAKAFMKLLTSNTGFKMKLVEVPKIVRGIVLQLLA